jgi:hypothetical protein
MTGRGCRFDRFEIKFPGSAFKSIIGLFAEILVAEYLMRPKSSERSDQQDAAADTGKSRCGTSHENGRHGIGQAKI